MSNASLKWGLGLVLLGMLADTVTPHPLLEVKNEYQFEGLIPQPVVLGFANERQWLFALCELRNQCVLEALGGQRKRAGKPSQLVAARVRNGSRVTDLRSLAHP